MTTIAKPESPAQRAVRPSPFGAHFPSSPALSPAPAKPHRSRSSTRITELGWAPSPSVALTLEASNVQHDRVKESYRAWRTESWAAQKSRPIHQSHNSHKLEKAPASTGTWKGKGKGKALSFVVGAPSSGSGEDGDVEASQDMARDAVHDDDEDAPGPSRPKALSVEEIIRRQIRQPVQTVDSQDLDSLLPAGISDYSFILRPEPIPQDHSPAAPASPPDQPTSLEASPAAVRTQVEHTSAGPKLGRVSLGKGKFSEVLLVRKGETEYALKHTPLHPHHPLIASRLLREPTILAQLLPHPNLVKVYETVRTQGHFYLVEENLEDSITLEALVTDQPNGVLPPEMAWSVLDQLSSVVKSLHEPLRVCHRDIKPENILIKVTPSPAANASPTLLLKLLDFGLATHYSSSEPKLTTCCGSPAYHSPELWKSLREPSGTVKYWGPEVDIWCVGLTLLRCLTPNKYPLGIAHSSIFALSDKVVDALLAIQDEPLRRVLAILMQMDGEKRMQGFSEFCTSRPEAIIAPSVGKKEFKSTSFLPSERTHTLNLPLSPSSPRHLTLSRSPSRSRAAHQLHSDLPTSAVAELSRPGVAPEWEGVLACPDLISDASSTVAPSMPVTPRSYSRERFSASPPIELVLVNSTDEPIRRATSYIKYALRCAGILFHVRDNLSDTAFSAVTTDGSDAEDDSAFVCQLQCVVKLPNSEQSRASSALIAALRPPISRAHTMGTPVRSSSTPPTGKQASKKKELVKALTFFLSIRKAESDPEDSPATAFRRHLRQSSSTGEALSSTKASRRRRPPGRIIITLSDERALGVVREALKSEETEPTSTTDSEDQRGRSGTSLPRDQQPSLGARVHSGSRDARNRRLRQPSGPSTPIPEDEGSAGATGLGMGIATSDLKRASVGFFDFAFSKFPGLGSRQNSTSDLGHQGASTPTLSRSHTPLGERATTPSTSDEAGREEARAAAMAAVAF